MEKTASKPMLKRIIPPLALYPLPRRESSCRLSNEDAKCLLESAKVFGLLLEREGR